MTDAELLSLGLGSAAALVAAVLVIVGLGVMLQFDRLIGRWVALAVVPLMGLGMAASSLLSGRDLRQVFYHLQGLNVGASEGGSNVLRALTVVLVGTCAATVVVRLFARPGAGPRLPGQGLMLAFLLYFGCAAWLNALFGTVPAFSHHSLYVPVAFAAVFVWREQPIQPLLLAAKWTLIGVMLMSLLAAVLLPNLALQPDYKGWIPGLRVRLWGVGSNPNSIGPLGLVLILLELMVPARRRSLRWLAFVLGAAVLLLAQSKTAWAAALLVAPVLLWYQVGRAANGGMRRVDYRVGLDGSATQSEPPLRDILPCYRRLGERLEAGLVPPPLRPGARRLLASHLINIARLRAGQGDTAAAIQLLLRDARSRRNPAYWLRSLFGMLAGRLSPQAQS